MKKGLILGILIIMLNSMMFAEGTLEQPQTVTLNVNNINTGKLVVGLQERLGFAKIALNFTNLKKNIMYCALKYGEDYFDLVSTKQLSNDFGGQLFGFLQNPPVSQNFAFNNAESEKWKCLPSESGYMTNACTTSANDLSSNLSSYKPQNVYLPVKYSCEDTYKLLIIVGNVSGLKYECYSFKLLLEFFQGEKSLYDQMQLSTYEKKSYLFLKYVFGQTGQQDAFNNIEESVFKSDTISELRDTTITFPANVTINGQTIESADAIKSSLYKNFARALRSQFIIRYEDRKTLKNIPYFDCSQEDLFDGIYGNFRNIYIASFLYVCFRDSKSITSSMLEKALYDANLSNPDGTPIGTPAPTPSPVPELFYNSANYISIDQTQGNAIADMALRYISWGVEYTPYISTKTLDAGVSSNEVFDKLMEDNGHFIRIVDKWINDFDLQQRGNNYAPTQPVNVNVSAGWGANTIQPKKIQTINGDFTNSSFKIVGSLNAAKKMNISRIFAWTSQNIAWDDNRVISTIASTHANLGETTALNDKNIYLDSLSGTKKNMHIPSVIVNGNPYKEVGYVFSATEKVQALLVVKGLSSTPSGNIGTGSEKFYEIKYADSLGQTQTIKPYINSIKLQPIDAKASSTFSGTLHGYKPNPGAVIDTNNNSFWRSNDHGSNEEGHWIYVKLNSVQRIGKIVLDWESSYPDDGWPSEYDIQVLSKTNGEPSVNDNWQTIYTVMDGKHEKRAIDLSYTNASGNYVRMYTKKSGGGFAYLLWDFEVFTGNDAFDEYVEVKDTGILKCTKAEAGNASAIGQNTLIPGRSLYTDEYTKEDGVSNSSVSCSYLVFRTPINCNEIRLVDFTGNSFLNIAELMVFPENPIQYTSQQSTDIKLASKDSIVVQGGNEGYEWMIDNNETSSKDPSFVLMNGNPLRYISLSLKPSIQNNIVDYIQLNFENSINVKQITAYEPDGVATEYSATYKENLNIYYGTFGTGGLLYFTDNNERALYTDYFGNKLTTPFYYPSANSSLHPVPGNPIPYTAFGIDTPRTFNYKMYKQWEAREWFKKKSLLRVGTDERLQRNMAKYLERFTDKATTIAKDVSDQVNYGNSYLNEMEALKLVNSGAAININSDYTYSGNYYPTDMSDLAYTPDTVNLVKPFLPGYRANNKMGYIKAQDPPRYSPYDLDKIAGVDSMGLLVGALSMCDLNRDVSNNGGKAVVNIFNQDVSDEADRYFEMQGTAPGLDATGKPSYYKVLGTSYMDGNYRFEKTDLEKSSIIVPDIRVIRRGDLIVKYDLDSEPHIGIVVGMLWDETNGPPAGLTVDQLMSKVLVVSTRKGFTMALIGRWGNSDGVFGGFADDPKQYHVRRLLKQKQAEIQNIKPPESALIQKWLDSLKCDVFLPDDAYNVGQKNHWIPNTSEYLGGITVKLSGFEKNQANPGADGIEVSLSDYSHEIAMISPYDLNAYSGQSPNDKDNIKNNHGGGILFSAEVLVGEAKQYTWLARCTLKGSITKDDVDSGHCYNVAYNPEIFDTSGIGINGYKLYVVNNYLYFENEQLDIRTDKFGVIALDPSRPGDDFMLRFCLAGDPTVESKMKTQNPDMSGFMAVYDKKMLWRANAYLDESMTNYGGHLSDIIDWNDKNPWTAEQGNTWAKDTNIPYIMHETYYNAVIQNILNGQDRSFVVNSYKSIQIGVYTNERDRIIETETFYILDEFAATYDRARLNNILQNVAMIHKPFGQIYIRPFTSMYTAVNPNNNDRWLGPHQVFNAVSYSLGCNDTPEFFNEDLSDQRAVLRAYFAGWDTTLAPALNNSSWSIYKIGKYDPDYRNQKLIDNIQKFPYRPGYSSYINMDDDPDTGWFDPPNALSGGGNTVKYSAGVECQGFVTRATGYDNNGYSFPKPADSIKCEWNNYNADGIDIHTWPNRGWHITEAGADSSPFIVPGDVLWHGGHVAIVNKVVYHNNLRSLGKADVYLIEAHGGPMKVRNDRTWANFATEANNNMLILRLYHQ